MVSLSAAGGPSVAPDGSLPVSRSAARVAAALVSCPLGSAADVAPVVGTRVSGVYSKLRELQEAGMAGSVSLGWSLGHRSRWWLSDEALSRLGLLGSSWHEEWGRSRLLERLPLVEWFYRVAGSLTEMGQLRSFQWLSGLSLDAAVRYDRGWVALFWSGLWQTERTLMARLERLGHEMDEYSLLSEPAWPGLLAFVVSDRWQRELVYRAFRRYGLLGRVPLAIWCCSDGSRSGSPSPGPSRGWIHQPVEAREMGGWSWEDRVESCPWGQTGSAVVGRVLDVVAEWPGINTVGLKLAVGEGDSERRCQRACRRMVEAGLLRSISDGPRLRYVVAGGGVNLLIRRDGIGVSHLRERGHVGSWMDQMRNVQAHEDGVMSLMCEFMASGLPSAAGWRCWEHLGGGGGIAPDGMVLLEQSPYGPGWHYVEYERSARRRYRIGRKLNGYCSDRRQNSWPVMVAVWDVEAEEIFQEVGRGSRLNMLTASIGHLADRGALGSPSCWSMYGAPVMVG